MDKRDKIIGSMVMLIGCSIFLIVGYILSQPKSTNEEEILLENKIQYKDNRAAQVSGKLDDSNSENSNSDEFKKIIVEIKGEVKNPNVYIMDYNSRVNDLIKKAGGFTDEADVMSVNSSMKLKDEDCIIIYNKNEEKNIGINNSISRRNENTKADGGKININTASKEELNSIPGIGDVTAQKIIDYRESEGGFKSIEELTNIDRIGPKTLEKIRDKIQVR
ncbi:ComE operon protein 1 [Clostridium homopropionicum DSM 5847]|uniref:ComE operon protein 1 n=1 Tax=Clostridium homopropionicum DSM 5847 TaxID=1121318 RepID=A0A0L6ZE90_9CLOT|nr:helix-hairpin-helix domain-containing protein [Clostridium homopropionicum]KOA21257.1 ComE operon protein 1 [Clostridium homopropionicum DSM 5847]SFG28904.1 competence protein ComEA [Clostridium homopropionicum]